MEHEPDRMDYGLVLAFDTNSAEFARGVEVGRLWERLAADDAPFEQMVHVANAEMVLRIAGALGREVSSREHDETWMTVCFGEGSLSARY